jgi:hypothetical protein
MKYIAVSQNWAILNVKKLKCDFFLVGGSILENVTTYQQEDFGIIKIELL